MLKLPVLWEGWALGTGRAASGPGSPHRQRWQPEWVEGGDFRAEGPSAAKQGSPFPTRHGGVRVHSALCALAALLPVDLPVVSAYGAEVESSQKPCRADIPIATQGNGDDGP